MRTRGPRRRLPGPTGSFARTPRLPRAGIERHVDRTQCVRNQQPGNVPDGSARNRALLWPREPSVRRRHHGRTTYRWFHLRTPLVFSARQDSPASGCRIPYTWRIACAERATVAARPSRPSLSRESPTEALRVVRRDATCRRTPPTPKRASIGALLSLMALLAGCRPEQQSVTPEIEHTWWERIDTGTWWFKGGKSSKESPLTGCDALSPGYATIRVHGLEALDDFNARILDCDAYFSWAGGWPTQLFQKALSRVADCSAYQLDGWDGFTLGESTLHLRVLTRDDGALLATFDARWPPDLDEVTIGPTPMRIVDPDGVPLLRTLSTDCPDGGRERRCPHFLEPRRER